MTAEKMQAGLEDALEATLAYDPIRAAEAMTGKRYDEDEGRGTIMLGFLLNMEHARHKARLLDEADDTHLSNDLDRYCRIVIEEGFTEVLRVPFVARGYREGDQETLFVFWHPADGLLLRFDTYRMTQVNSADLYYNWRFGQDFWENRDPNITGSGGICRADRSVWAGYHDGREALRSKLRRMRQHGSFVTPWIEQPFLWLLHYMDTKDEQGNDLGYGQYDHQAITAARVALLPAEVQAAIKGGQ